MYGSSLVARRGILIAVMASSSIGTWGQICTSSYYHYPECPEVLRPELLRVFVCEARLTNDNISKKETSVTALPNGCETPALLGTWMDDAGSCSTQPADRNTRIALSRSGDSGRNWAPVQATACALQNGRRFHCDCYFLRILGDYDGDFDLDAANGGASSDYAGMLSCWQLSGPYPRCSPCRYVDFNGDGYVDIYDFNYFFNGDPIEPVDPPYTGPLCDCHGPCHIDTGCLAGGAAFSGEGLMQAIDQRQPCAAVARFLAVTPAEEVSELREFLMQRMAAESDSARLHEMEYCLACLIELTE